jgi:hypothetical protein
MTGIQESQSVIGFLVCSSFYFKSTVSSLSEFDSTLPGPCFLSSFLIGRQVVGMGPNVTLVLEEPFHVSTCRFMEGPYISIAGPHNLLQRTPSDLPRHGFDYSAIAGVLIIQCMNYNYISET